MSVVGNTDKPAANGTGYTHLGIDHSKIPDSISPTKARTRIQERLESIFADWELLKTIVNHHEATIHKRWLKKTKKQRTQVLLQAWPDMAASHRPDFAAWRLDNSTAQEKPTAKVREACMWPYINLENLTKPKSLLLLLRSRTQHGPATFAFVDWNSAHFGCAVGRVTLSALNRHTMMFLGRQNVGGYGELVCWDDDAGAEEQLLSDIGMYPGHGLIVLEIQQRMWQFLVSCAKSILHDLSTDALVNGGSSVLNMAALEPSTVDGFAAQAIMVAESPYRAPQI